jgi:hypothetical protein
MLDSHDVDQAQRFVLAQHLRIGGGELGQGL